MLNHNYPKNRKPRWLLQLLVLFWFGGWNQYGITLCSACSNPGRETWRTPKGTHQAGICSSQLDPIPLLERSRCIDRPAVGQGRSSCYTHIYKYRFTSSVWNPLPSYHFLLQVGFQVTASNLDSFPGQPAYTGRSAWSSVWHGRKRGRCNVHATRGCPTPWVIGKSMRWCCSCGGRDYLVGYMAGDITC